MTKQLAKLQTKERFLSREDFKQLAEVPLAVEWLQNLKIKSEKTKIAYNNDVKQFFEFAGITKPDQLREVTRMHVIAWTETISHFSNATIRRKLSALSSLYKYLCEENAVTINPVKGVKRPSDENPNEGKTPAISAEQAKELLDYPETETLKGIRDRTILSALLFHGLRRDELCKLRVQDYQARKGILHFVITGKGDKKRYVPVAPHTQALITAYLEEAGHADDLNGALFRPTTNNPQKGKLNKHLNPSTIYRLAKKYGKETGISIETHDFTTHSLRATAATNALENKADITRVQNWLGHKNISTTRLYDKREDPPEESPSFKVSY